MRILVSALLLVGLAVPGLASAEEEGRSATLQLSLSPYRPDIDAQVNGSPGPYETVFGAGNELMFQIGWESHIISDAGALSVGMTFGYWSVEGNTLLEGGGTGGDKTKMQMLPIQAQLSYRFDMFAEYFPLAPIGRVGLDYYLWRILDGTGEVAQFSPGNEAFGGTYGWHAAFGVHLLLDFFAIEMATDFERDAGVYNSFLTAEWRYSQVDEFGSATSFRLGDSSFVFGLALEL